MSRGDWIVTGNLRLWRSVSPEVVGEEEGLTSQAVASEKRTLSPFPRLQILRNFTQRIKRSVTHLCQREPWPTVFGGDPDGFAKRLAYHQRNAEEELLLIGSIRQHIARILRTLRPEDLQRRGIHSEHGPIMLSVMMEHITGHIPHHLQFIEGKNKALGIC